VLGNGVADDTAAIQAAIDANPGKVIYFPSGFYFIYSTLTVNSDGTVLEGGGPGVSSISQKTPNIDTIKFAPTTAGTTAAYLNNSAIRGLNISHTAVASSSTSGAGVRFLQCNNYKLFNVTVNNAPEGITVQGGQLGSLKSFQIYASSGLTTAADTALLYFRQAPYGASFQPCYTVEVEDFRLSATLLRNTCIYVRNGDGINFTNGYVAYGSDSLMKIKAERDNSYVSGISCVNVYFDCVNISSTPYGIRIPIDGFANTFVYLVKIGSGCIIGNGSGIGILCQKPETMILAVDGATIINMTSWAINCEGSTALTDLHVTGSEIQNCGDATSGGIRAVSGRTLNITGTTFSSTENLCLKLEGTWTQGVVTGCSNSSSVADISNTATFTYGLVMATNSSRLARTSAFSWQGQ